MRNFTRESFNGYGRPDFGMKHNHMHRPDFGMGYNRPNRPDFGMGYNRPDFGMGYNRPHHLDFGMGYNRPNRLDFGMGYSRPNRPDFGMGYNRPNHLDFGMGYNRPHHPDFGMGINRPDSGLGIKRHRQHFFSTILTVLSGYPDGIKQSELAEKAGINCSKKASKIIFKLESNGYVAREIDENDKDATILKLTEMGQARAREISSEMESGLEERLSKLTENERQALSKALEKVSA